MDGRICHAAKPNREQDARDTAEGTVMNHAPRELDRVPLVLKVCLVLVSVGALRASDPLVPEIPPLPLPVLKAVQPNLKPLADEPKAATEKKNGTEKEKKSPPWKAWQPPGRAVTLTESITLASQRQPAILAAQYSLAASQRGYLALTNLRRAAEWLSADLPYRKRQAIKGIEAATAEVRKAMQESVYDTSRMYFEYVRATQQEQTAADIIEQMEIYYRVAENLLNEGVVDPSMKLNRFTLYALESAINEVRVLREKAGYGRRLAIAALAEALGQDASDPVYPIATKLPVMGGRVTEDQVVAFALDTRPELVQAAVLVDVSRLEVCAQNSLGHRHSVQTFAAGSDLHARVLPAPIRNGDYRPGAVPPEMPGLLVGKREDRVARATDYSQRMDEVYRKAANLVRLDAIKAFLSWKATVERMEQAEKEFERGKKMVDESRTAAATKQDPQLLVQNEALAFKAQAAYVESVYEHLMALLALERATSGQVRPGFGDR